MIQWTRRPDADVAGVVHKNPTGLQCVWRWRYFLPWAKLGIHVRVIHITRPNTNLQPPVVAIEHAASEIQCHRKVAVDYIHIRLVDVTTELCPCGVRIIQLELQIIEAIRGAVGIVEPSLIGKGRPYRPRLADPGPTHYQTQSQNQNPCNL